MGIKKEDFEPETEWITTHKENGDQDGNNSLGKNMQKEGKAWA
jgi:hypothetical protein